MSYKHQELQNTIRKNLMLSPLLYTQDELFATRMEDGTIGVSMKSLEDQKIKSRPSTWVKATLPEWQTLFEESPKLAKHLTDAFSKIGITIPIENG